MKNPPTQHDTGLKFFYRTTGVHLAHFFYKLFGVFNPNIITHLGTFIHVIYLSLFIFYKNPIIFVFGVQLALILDYVDGSYARLTNQTTEFGRKLDGIFDVVKIFLTFVVLFYLTINESIPSIILTFLFLTYAFSNNVKSLKLHIKRGTPIERETERVEKDNFMKNFLKIPFGFTLAHIYLYLSIWIFFDNIYILVILVLMGLLSSFETILDLFKK